MVDVTLSIRAMRDNYSTFDIVKAFKNTEFAIPRERLQEWILRGLTVASEPAKGVGTRAKFTRLDVYGIALFKKLIQRGIHRSAASDYVKHFIPAQKSNIHLGHAAYIIFRVRENGEKVIDTFTLAPGEYYINLSTGGIEDKATEEKTGIKFDITQTKNLMKHGRIKSVKWDYIDIINYSQMREDVDEALLKIE